MDLPFPILGQILPLLYARTGLTGDGRETGRVTYLMPSFLLPSLLRRPPITYANENRQVQSRIYATATEC